MCIWDKNGERKGNDCLIRCLIKKVNRVISLYLLLIFSISWVTRNPAARMSHPEVAAIKDVIAVYFETRYRAHQTFQLGDIMNVVGKTPYAQAFLGRESDKLSMEFHHLKRNQLRYLSYQYSLDFQKITINNGSYQATASVVEGHDVVFEISEKTKSQEPIHSKMRNLHHWVTLQKEGGAWKIQSDQYDDYFWRVNNSISLQKDDFLLLTEYPPASKNTENTKQTSTSAVCNLKDDLSTEEYNRSGAVSYAHQWATAPRPYNPDYFDFTDYGGDCNNFVSQAIHEGGGAQMVGDGTYGWYYNSVNDYAAAWTGVYYLYRFVTTLYEDFPLGPEGCGVSVNEAEVGDVIQYSWDGDDYWNHSVIIVQMDLLLSGDRTHWVAGHSPDVDNYPFEYFAMDHPDMTFRFLHIERLDGARLFLPLIEN